jgi:transcriptional regulator with GAF, ATPase, and Fis domain
LHEGSRVAEGPFVAVNCGAFVRDMIASELFGHRRGAFTGAVENRRGAFELADGGTLFLDEIGELPIDLQPMLLRVLETGEIRPVGSEQTTKLRVRVVAATNRDPNEEITKGRLREDLFYRLAVVRIELPPLRTRTEDIEPLAQFFAVESGFGPLPADVIAQLKRRTFPGNARELRNAVAAFGAVGHLPPDRGAEDNLDRELVRMMDLDEPYAVQKEALVDRFTQLYVRRLLERTNGNQAAAAKLAGLDRTYFGRLVARLLPSDDG